MHFERDMGMGSHVRITGERAGPSRLASTYAKNVCSPGNGVERCTHSLFSHYDFCCANMVERHGTHMQKFTSIQRKAALIIARAYRTVSTKTSRIGKETTYRTGTQRSGQRFTRKRHERVV